MSVLPMGRPVKQISWAQVALILGLTAALVGGVVLLALNDKSVTDVITVVILVVVPILGGLGIQFTSSVNQKLDRVQEATNGRITEILEDNKRLHAQVTALALAIQPSLEPEEK